MSPTSYESETCTITNQHRRPRAAALPRHLHPEQKQRRGLVLWALGSLIWSNGHMVWGFFKYWCWLSPVTWGRSYHCYHGYHIREWRPMVLALALTLQITEPSRTRVSASEEQDNTCFAVSRGCYKDQVSQGTRKSQLPLLSECTVLLQISTLIKGD